jgi:hypothetical protein
MKPIARFALERHDGAYEHRPLQSRLIADGKPTEVRLPGYDLLHQFEISSGYLLITDYDCPFEESTHFVLLGKDLRLLSSRSLGAPYASFLLKGVESMDDHHLTAVFHGEDRWRITIRPWGIVYLWPRLKLERCRDAEPRLPADARKA